MNTQVNFLSHHFLAHKGQSPVPLYERPGEEDKLRFLRCEEWERTYIHVAKTLQYNSYHVYRRPVVRNMCPPQHPHNCLNRTHPQPQLPLLYIIYVCIYHLSETICRILAPLGICTCFQPHITLWYIETAQAEESHPLTANASVVYYQIPVRLKTVHGQMCRTLE